MRKTVKKILSLVFAAILVITVGGGSIVEASPGGDGYPISVTVVKLKTDKFPDKDYVLPEKYWEGLITKEDGSIDFEKMGELMGKSIGGKINVEPLEGAKFHYFRVDSEDLFEEMLENPEDYDTFEKLKKAQIKLEKELGTTELGIKPAIRIENSDFPEFVFQVSNKPISKYKKEELTSGLYTNENGMVDFICNTAQPSSQDGGINIWIIEDIEENIGEAADVSEVGAVPMGLRLPTCFKDEEGLPGIRDAYDIVVYPKNKIGEKVTKEKTVEDERTKYRSIDNYQEFSWYMHANIKAGDLKKLTKLNFEDIVNDEKPIDQKFDYNDYKKLFKIKDNFTQSNAGYVFINEEPEVYIKKFNEASDESKIMLKKDVDYEYNFKVGDEPVGPNNLANKFNLSFKVNNKDAEKQKNYLFTEERLNELFKNKKGKDGKAFSPDDKLTIFVKVKSRYINNASDENVKKAGVHAPYTRERFDEDLKNQEINGISDDLLWNERINDFNLTYSHNPRGKGEVEADGNRIRPRVNTGGRKFIKVGRDLGRYFPLPNVKFYIDRRRSTAVYDYKKMTSDEEPYKTIHEYGKKSYSEKPGYPDLEYLIFNAKTGRKEWVTLSEEEDLEAMKNDGKIDENRSLYFLESDENGLFEIRGIEMDDYIVKLFNYGEDDILNEEINYAKVDNHFYLNEFKGLEGYQTYIRRDIATGRRPNMSGPLKVEEFEEKDKAKLPEDLDERVPIVNLKLIIPNTGSISKVIFILAGITIMLLSTIRYIKKRKELDSQES